jgi:hypothetical protein
MKKRILAVLFGLIVCAMLVLPCFAEESTESAETEPVETTETVPFDTEEEPAETEEIPEVEEPDQSGQEADEELAETDDGIEHDIFSRALEFATEYKEMLSEFVCSAALMFFAALVDYRNKKRNDDLSGDLKVVKGDAAGTVQAHGSMINAVNSMITGYNGMRESYEKYESVEDDRNKLIGAMMVQNTALLEILTTVYVNNKNLPQGVKDMVTLRYCNSQKLLGDDQALRAIVEAVREKVNQQIAQEDTQEPREAEESEIVETEE